MMSVFSGYQTTQSLGQLLLAQTVLPFSAFSGTRESLLIMRGSRLPFPNISFIFFIFYQEPACAFNINRSAIFGGQWAHFGILQKCCEGARNNSTVVVGLRRITKWLPCSVLRNTKQCDRMVATSKGAEKEMGANNSVDMTRISCTTKGWECNYITHCHACSQRAGL